MIGFGGTTKSESIQVLSHFLSVVVKNIIHDSCELYHQERILKKNHWILHLHHRWCSDGEDCLAFGSESSKIYKVKAAKKNFKKTGGFKSDETEISFDNETAVDAVNVEIISRISPGIPNNTGSVQKGKVIFVFPSDCVWWFHPGLINGQPVILLSIYDNFCSLISVLYDIFMILTTTHHTK